MWAHAFYIRRKIEVKIIFAFTIPSVGKHALLHIIRFRLFSQVLVLILLSFHALDISYFYCVFSVETFGVGGKFTHFERRECIHECSNMADIHSTARAFLHLFPIFCPSNGRFFF